MVNYLPSQATTSITVTSLDVGTTLTIGAPANITQGSPFIVEGTLRRNDTNATLSGETITISYNGTVLANPTTMLQEGSVKYQATVQIDAPGTFTLTADFAGSTRPGLTLLPSMAKTGVALIDGITQYLPIIVPAAILGWLLLSKK